MTIWKLATSGGDHSSYNELKQRNVIAQGWSGTGDLTFLFRGDVSLLEYWLNILLDDTRKGVIRTFRYLLSEMNGNHIVLAYDGRTIKGICEIPADFIYKFEDTHSACSGSCEYANCLFPVKWVDWKDFQDKIGQNPAHAKSRFEGIQEVHENSDGIYLSIWTIKMDLLKILQQLENVNNCYGNIILNLCWKNI